MSAVVNNVFFTVFYVSLPHEMVKLFSKYLHPTLLSWLFAPNCNSGQTNKYRTLISTVCSYRTLIKFREKMWYFYSYEFQQDRVTDTIWYSFKYAQRLWNLLGHSGTRYCQDRREWRWSLSDACTMMES